MCRELMRWELMRWGLVCRGSCVRGPFSFIRAEGLRDCARQRRGGFISTRWRAGGDTRLMGYGSGQTLI
jgi:hypothetical protein